MAQQFWTTATSGVAFSVAPPIYCLDGMRVAQDLSGQAGAGAVSAASLRAAVCCRMAEITATSLSTADGGAVPDAAAPRFWCDVVATVRASDGGVRAGAFCDPAGVLGGGAACAVVCVVA
jgi:hypothetical protein